MPCPPTESLWWGKLCARSGFVEAACLSHENRIPRLCRKLCRELCRKWPETDKVSDKVSDKVLVVLSFSFAARKWLRPPRKSWAGGHRGRIEQHTDKAFGLWGEDSAFAQHHSVGPVGKEFPSRNHLQLLFPRDANAHDDGDAQVEFDVFFDHFPATDFHRDLVRDPVLFEGAVHQTPGAQIAWRQDEGILADVFQGQLLPAGQW